MSTDQKNSWTTYALAATVSAAIGFGAIYVIAGGTGNGPKQQSAAKSSAATVETAKGAAKTESIETRAPGAKLNVGDMTTFVFKDEPVPVPVATFNNEAGQPITVGDMKGKVVLLNLWATWCAPCRKEMPDLDRLQAKLGSERFEVVAISVDRGSAAKSKKFLDDINVKSLKLYHDPSAQLGYTLKTIGMPSTLLIDERGRELGRLVGPAKWDSDDAIRLIRAHIPKATN